MNGYIGSAQYKSRPTLYQQAMMDKKKEQELYNFLSIGCGGRCKELSKQLNLALQKKKQIKLARRKTIKIMRKIGLDKGFAKKLALMLEKSGLSLDEQRVIMRQIKKLLLDFKRDMHNNLTLGRLNLHRLPISLRRFVIALIVLKAEIAHLFRLELEKQRVIREMNNLSRISVDDRNFGLETLDLNIDNHKTCRLGVSLSKGDYQGMRDFSQETSNQNQTTNKSMNFEFNTTKDDRNQAERTQKNENKYYKQEQNVNEAGNTLTKSDFYQENIMQQEQR